MSKIRHVAGMITLTHSMQVRKARPFHNMFGDRWAPFVLYGKQGIITVYLAIICFPWFNDLILQNLKNKQGRFFF